jgi:Flp pilus assembly protein TadG
VKQLEPNAFRTKRDRESGQAMVEFALILFPLLILVAGIIQFGIGLNYWLDLNRIANQGARHAVVNHWPGCAANAAGNSCTTTTWNCTGAPPTNLSLSRWLYCQTQTQGLRNSATVQICYPPDSDPDTTDGRLGAPVRVQLSSPFEFVPILKIGTIQLRARATMRLEQDTLAPGSPNGHLSGVTACT